MKYGKGVIGEVDGLKEQDFLKTVDGCAVEDDCLAFMPACWGGGEDLGIGVAK